MAASQRLPAIQTFAHASPTSLPSCMPLRSVARRSHPAFEVAIHFISTADAAFRKKRGSQTKIGEPMERAEDVVPEYFQGLQLVACFHPSRLPPHHSAMPKTMPTPCIDTLRCFMTEGPPVSVKFLSWNNISKCVSVTMPTSKLLIFFVILVRDQEVGGSNPLAPTT